MPATRLTPLRFWILVAASFILLLWLFSPALLPFLVGLAIAYFLEPSVSALERRKVPRWLGSTIILAAFFFFFVFLFFMMWPMISGQIGALIDNLPDYIATIRKQHLPWLQKWAARISPEYVAKIREATTQSTDEAVGFVGRTVRNILSSGFAIIDFIGLAVLTPITAFYVLRDWKSLTDAIDGLIPRHHYTVVREQLGEINQTLSGFIRGQAIVSLFLGAFYGIGLALNGLQYGATIGLIAGVLSMIPYVGTFFGSITSFILAAVQFSGDWARIGLVMSVFIFGNIIETYFLTPRLVGSRIGLHPVWVMFALIAAIKLAGFTGALIAVPAAAVIGVLIRFGVKQFKASALYK